MTIPHSLLDEVKSWRRDFHRHPELGFEEHRTSDRVAQLLSEFGLDVHRGLGGTGVVGTLRNGEGPTIGLRADMDALPFTELGDIAHKSCHSGAMHACGHDGHTAILLGAAKVLSQTKSFSGTVHFVFQPAEENLGGALKMVDEGLFTLFPMDAIYGLHNWPGRPVGEVAINERAMMASLDTFKITLTGKSCHAAIPNDGYDPIVASAELVTALQTIVARRLSPLESAVVSVTKIQGGEAINIIPEKVVLEGTYRCLDNTVRQKVKTLIGEIAEQVPTAHRVSSTIEFFDGYSVTTNHPKQAEQIRAAAIDAFGAERVAWNIAPSMASEDFSYMLEHCPGAYCWLGADGSDSAVPLHNAYYDFNDELLETGILLWKNLIERLLK
ncbi:MULTISPECIES: M20 aminoacylase family protein [Vibrio]|uniref:Amidohydrolase n=2 Tax=Vibrio TaxID=662 RepID=A0A7X4RVL0_9VIBR|nr:MULTISPECIES: M20 aminoacylase family protein [Vibrio]MBF9000158.1 amidohydrolase [Vibrio nitrifigilis]MZI94402.1 amidohydrolase [Vibrio eleionomae]